MINESLQPGIIVRSPKRAYTIRRVLGQGGFGITYLVDTPLKMGNITFKAKFALKELFVHSYCFRCDNSCEVVYRASKTQEMARFRRSFVSEAQRLQRLDLNHPNIVNVDEVFEANGTAYYVMEYIEGDT
ncbi:MAG: serine/threonine protein kinase, partial [Muribaculaceae bacterium]